MATIRPKDLPAAPSVTETGAFVVDSGATVQKATASQIVDAAIPLASQAEAEAGTDNAKRVTPLRVKQAIDALGVSAANLASTAAGKGAELVAYKRPSGVNENVKAILDKLGMSPASFGAPGDGATPDTSALSDLATAVAASAWHREIQLDAKTYAVDGATDGAGGWHWTEANGAFIRGRGIGRTVIQNTDSGGSALTLGSTQNLYVGDLTLEHSGGFAALYAPNGGSWENIICQRVKFTGSTSGGNGVQWVINTLGTTAQNIWFIDCVWEDLGRMGGEFQNQIHDGVARIGSIYIIRPRVSRVGLVDNGMGFSFSGPIDGGLIDRPVFDDCPYACIELVGGNRIVTRDALYVPDDAGQYLVAATGTLPMYGNKIDGFRPVTRAGQALTTTPAVASQVRLDNFHDGQVRGVQIHRSDNNALNMGENYPSNGNVIEGCHLQSSGGGVFQSVSCAYSQNNKFLANHITSAGVVGIGFADTSGAGGSALATNNMVDNCTFDLTGSATALRPITLTGSATCAWGGGNAVVGYALHKTGVFTLTAGTNNAFVPHGVLISSAVVPSIILTPRARVWDGANNAQWWMDYDAANIAVNTSASVTDDVPFYWEVRTDFGNI